HEIVEQEEPDQESGGRDRGHRRECLGPPAATRLGRRGRRRGVRHVRRNLAAKAPSQPWMCGNKRMKPCESTTASGSTQVAESSTMLGVWRRNRSTTSSVSSGSNEHTL